MTRIDNRPLPADLAKENSSNVSLLDLALGRVDLIAIVAALVGLGLFLATIVVMAAMEAYKLALYLWNQPGDRWLLAALALAVIWILARWKRICVL